MPADYERHTGGWAYDQRIAAELEALGWTVDRLDLPAGFPRPDRRARVEARQLIAELPDGTLVLADQLALGVMPEMAEREGQRLRLAMIVHHPLALEDGLTPTEAEHFRSSECASLQPVALAIVPSVVTANALTNEYAVPAERIVLAPPGTDRARASQGSSDDTLRLLSIGSIVPRKDHGALIEALAPLTHLSWRLTIAGSIGLAPDHVAHIQQRIRASGLADRIVLTGTLDPAEIEPLWQSADLYVAASRHEGYGMAIAEAIAHGIPVVSTDAGAVGQWVDRRAAIIVPVGDSGALRDALFRALADAGLRRRLREGAMVAREALPTWQTSAKIVSDRLAVVTTSRG